MNIRRVKLLRPVAISTPAGVIVVDEFNADHESHAKLHAEFGEMSGNTCIKLWHIDLATKPVHTPWNNVYEILVLPDTGPEPPKKVKPK